MIIGRLDEALEICAPVPGSPNDYTLTAQCIGRTTR